jgi:hypothetical protein
MIQRPAWFQVALALILSGLALACCGSPSPPSDTPSPLPAPSRVAATTPTATATATRLPATPEPTDTPTWTPSPTATPTATNTPTPSRTPRPTYTRQPTSGPYPSPTRLPTGTPVVVTNADPSDKELFNLVAEWVLTAPLDEWTFRGFTWMGYPWMVEYQQYDPVYARRHQDLDGDGQDEIILWANWADLDTPAFLTVFAWRDGLWLVDLVVWDEYAHYWSGVYPDLAGLGRAQIMVDFVGRTGGTGLSTHVWTRSLIHCTNGHCSEVWQGILAVDEYHVECNPLLVLEMSHLALAGDCLVEESSGTWAYIASGYCGLGHDPSVTILPKTHETFCWDGQRYASSDVEQVSPGYVVQEIVDGPTCHSDYPLLWSGLPNAYLGEGYKKVVDDFWGNPGLRPVAAAQHGLPGTPEERIAGIFDPEAPEPCPVRIVSPGQDRRALHARVYLHALARYPGRRAS